MPICRIHAFLPVLPRRCTLHIEIRTVLCEEHGRQVNVDALFEVIFPVQLQGLTPVFEPYFPTKQSRSATRV